VPSTVKNAPPGRSVVAGLLALCGSAAGVPAESRAQVAIEVAGIERASTLSDLSGLAWLGGDRFLAVHDAKYPDEADLPRVSLLRLTGGPDGFLWHPVPVASDDVPSDDFESVARIPGGGDRPRVLLVESTEKQVERPYARRIFLAEVDGESVTIVDRALWPVATVNVEGTAVAEVEGKLLFVYAERAGGRDSTEILFAELTLDPIAFGAFRSAGAFASPGPTGPAARPVSALEFDADGTLYAASAEDPDDDDGPFRSAVYRIGRVTADEGGTVALDGAPVPLGVLDGLKVEGVAAREREDGSVELWVGVDDENYGGTMRPLRTHGAPSAGAPVSRSPYAHRGSSEIKTLSQEEVDDLLLGRGMGLARPAELNGYPGPRHVLDLADSLDLTAEQRGIVGQIFGDMNARAIELGGEVLAAERDLDAAFASGGVTEDALAPIVDRIADLRAELRAVHLRAHLATREVLTTHQRHEYHRLRGYAAGHDAGHADVP
jgi:hypothetical protein